MSSHDVDIESPKSADLISVKGEECSVGTHPSDSSDVDSQSSNVSPAASVRKLFLVLILMVAIALSVGLGLGLRDRRQRSQSSLALETNAPGDSSTVQEDQSAIATPIEPALEEPEYEAPQEPEMKPPPTFTGIGSIGNSLEWPALVGLSGEEAKQILEDLGQGYEVVIVPPGVPTTKDLRYDRIFLYVNEEGHVSQVPRPGR